MEDFFQPEKLIKEKRRFPRFPIRYFGVFYIPGQTVYCSVIDISKGGVGIVISKEPFFSDPVDVRIKYDLGNTDKTDLHMKANLVWSKGIVLNNMYRSGFAIKDIYPDYQENFEYCLQDLKSDDSVNSEVS